MPSLPDLQAQFLRALFAGNSNVEVHIREGSLTSAARLEIYRNNVFANLTDALRAVYPVVLRLVGDEFFAHAARHYIYAHPSGSGDIHEFGKAFGEFLASFPGAQQLVYLPDTARLEWHVHEAFHSTDHEPLALERLWAVTPEKYGELLFHLHPACRLLASPYPVHRIWQVNQSDFAGEETVDLDEGEARLLVSRPRFKVQITPLSAGGYALMDALAERARLSAAVERALEVEPELDASGLIARQVQRGAIVDFSLREQGDDNE